MTTSRTLNILIVHGIGWGGKGTSYANPLRDNIRREFDRAIRRLRLRDVDRRAVQARHALRFEVVCWEPVTQEPQNALLRLMFGRGTPLRGLSPTYQFRRNMVSLLGDVIAYEGDPHNKVYRAIHAEIDKCVNALGQASATEEGAANDYAPLTVIGHSLGSVIASDYVWDHTRSTGHSHRLAAPRLALTNFITMGSPMALYALRNNAYGKRDSIREGLDSPIQVDPDGGLWLNMYDPDDAIAFPLEKIESYNRAGVIDCRINAGNWFTSWNLLSHIGYWRCDEAAYFVARKLALDWARLNSPRFAERGYDKALADLRKELRRR